MMIKQGWLTDAVKIPSPNFNERPTGAAIDLIVVHAISLPPGEYHTRYIIDFFCNQLDTRLHPYFVEIGELKVSAHLLITRRGDVIQFVGFDQRAWHAGESVFHGVTNCNDFSIGIELEGDDETPFTDAQYHKLSNLCLTLIDYYSIPRDHIAGHEDIAPGRKTDPGPCFDWSRFQALISSPDRQHN